MRKVVNITSVSERRRHRRPGRLYGIGQEPGINGLTKVMAKEWGRYNVQRGNSVGFGFIANPSGCQPLGELDRRDRHEGPQKSKSRNPAGRHRREGESAISLSEAAPGPSKKPPPDPCWFFCSSLSDYVRRRNPDR